MSPIVAFCRQGHELIDLWSVIPKLLFCAGMELAAATDVLLIVDRKGEMKIISWRRCFDDGSVDGAPERDADRKARLTQKQLVAVVATDLVHRYDECPVDA